MKDRSTSKFSSVKSCQETAICNKAELSIVAKVNFLNSTPRNFRAKVHLIFSHSFLIKNHSSTGSYTIQTLSDMFCNLNSTGSPSLKNRCCMQLVHQHWPFWPVVAIPVCVYMCVMCIQCVYICVYICVYVANVLVHLKTITTSVQVKTRSRIVNGRF